MCTPLPSRQRFTPRLPDSSLNSREELWREKAVLVACCEDYAICRKLKLVACVQSFLEVDVNEDVRGISHACVEISILPL